MGHASPGSALALCGLVASLGAITCYKSHMAAVGPGQRRAASPRAPVSAARGVPGAPRPRLRGAGSGDTPGRWVLWKPSHHRRAPGPAV